MKHAERVVASVPSGCQDGFIRSRSFAFPACLCHWLALGVMVTLQTPGAAAQGLLPDDPLLVNTIPRAQAHRSFLAPNADLSSFMPPPGNQGAQGACAAWAVAYGLRSYYLRTDSRWSDEASWRGSPAFLYNRHQRRRSVPDCQSGMTLSAALAELRGVGVLSIAEFPYDPSDCLTSAPPALDARAAQWSVRGFQRVDLQRSDDVKGQILAGHPVVFGMGVSQRFQHLRGADVYNARSNEPVEYGHAMVIVGYDDARDAFRVLNSWGTHWGDGGFGWIGYDTTRTRGRIFEAFTLTDQVPQRPVIRAIRPAEAPQPPSPPSADVEARPQRQQTELRQRDESARLRLEAEGRARADAEARQRRQESEARLRENETLAQTAIRLRLEHGISALQCASVTLRDAGGRTMLSGYVGSTEDRDRVLELLHSGGGKGDVAIRPWPQCEALQTLSAPLATGNMQIAARGAPSHGSARLRVGEPLVLEVTTPDFPSYLYVAYLAADGSALYLLQPEGPLAARHSPGTRLVFGAPPHGDRYTIAGPPFGHEMVIAVASASPLFAEPLAETQTEREFLTAFRRSLTFRPDPTRSPRRTAAAVLLLETSER